jgi:hypothetical protein
VGVDPVVRGALFRGVRGEPLDQGAEHPAHGADRCKEALGLVSGKDADVARNEQVMLGLGR